MDRPNLPQLVFRKRMGNARPYGPKPCHSEARLRAVGISRYNKTRITAGGDIVPEDNHAAGV